ncbi:MAG: type 1 glutamine amidotransferase [Chloroflexota bacterium]
MKIIVLQHINIEDPGYLKDLMLADGWELTTIELDEGDSIPADFSQFDAMLCMGGPMDTWMEENYPWLIDEKKRIKEFVVDMEKPFLGFCLGCQLLGDVVGGQVVRSNPPEIGLMDITLTRERLTDPLFAEYPETIQAVQWHSYEVQGLENNADVTILGASPTTKSQIFRYKQRAYGIQFHIEVKDDTVNQWSCVPEYKTALENSLGAAALQTFDKATQEAMPTMNHLATLLYENFKQLIMSKEVAA